jgi:putative flavoprotein involved in K+ transport
VSSDAWQISMARARDLRTTSSATVAASDLKLASLLHRIDTFIDARGLSAPAPPDFVPHCLTFADAETLLDLHLAGIGTVLWATGFRRSYPWLRVPVLDEHGEIRHEGGLTPLPGLYVVGLHFLRRRNSSFIDGVGADALVLSEHLAQFLRESRRIRQAPSVNLGAAS